MGAPFPHGTTVTRLRGTVVSDGYGGTQRDWTNPQRLTISGAGLAPTVEPEQHQAGRDGTEVGWTLYCATADVTAYDRIESRFGLFEVDGDPGIWESPFTGQNHGMVTRLRRVEG